MVDDLLFRVIFGFGYCVGYIVFYNEVEKVLMGGDILFCGSFGRMDFLGGDMEMLKFMIFNKIFMFLEDVIVFFGYGFIIIIGVEKKINYILEF